MNAAAVIITIRRVTDDVTMCRRCGTILSRGRRVAFVADTGNVCLRCLITRPARGANREPSR